MLKASDVIRYMNEIAPESQAVPDDPIGLHVGDADREVSRIGVALDASCKTVQNAIEANINMLITHHPLIYRPLKRVVPGDAVSTRVMELVCNDIVLYCAHTNFDRAAGGTNDTLAEVLGLQDIEHIIEVNSLDICKLAVYVPEDNADELAQALGDAGAGSIGLYSHCSFWTTGTGYFKPLEGSNPYIGTKDKLEAVKEIRLEMVCPESLLPQMMSVIQRVHPYETPAYDIYALKNDIPNRGIGRVGNLSNTVSLEDFAGFVNHTLQCNGIRVYGDCPNGVKRVAICSGGGSRFYREAFAHGADVFVTGDVSFHDSVDMQSMKMAMIDAGHFETEKPGVVALAARLRAKYANSGVSVDYIE